MSKLPRVWIGNAQLEKLLKPVVELKEDAKNVRMHNEKNLGAIARSLSQFGQQKAIVIRNGSVVAGNGTLKAAREVLGWSHVACVEFSGTERQAKAFAVMDNRSAETAEWDWEGLADIFREFKGGDDGLAFKDMGFEDYEVGPMLEENWNPPGAEVGKTKDPTGGSIKLNVQQREVFNRAMEELRVNSKNASDAEGLVLMAERFLASKM